MRAIVLCQIPDSDASTAITADDFALIRVDHDIIHRTAMTVASLHGTAPGFPDLNSAVFGTSDHPFPLAVKGNSSDISRVTLKVEERIRVCRFDIVKLHRVVAGSREESLVGGDGQSVDLRIRMLDCARANSRQSFPEPVNVSISDIRSRGRKRLPDSVIIARFWWQPSALLSSQ